MLASSVQAVVACNAKAPKVYTLVRFIVFMHAHATEEVRVVAMDLFSVQAKM